MAIQVSKETTKALTKALQRFALDELDVDLGDLKASLLLDFVLREVGPTIHNAALDEAARYFMEKAEDLAGRHLKESTHLGR